MIYNETQKFLLMYFLLEYWKKEYIKSVIDRKQRLESSLVDSIENPVVIGGLTFIEKVERFGKKDRKLKDGIVYGFPPQQIDRSAFKKSVNFIDEYGELSSLTLADVDYASRSITFVEKENIVFNQMLFITPDDWVPRRGQEKRVFKLIEDIVLDESSNNVAKSLLAGAV